MSTNEGHFDFQSLVRVCQTTTEYFRGTSVRAINRNLVLRNWFVGYYIIEFEQGGQDRAKYGSGTLKQLSKELGRGFSVQNLELMRRFSASFGPSATTDEKSQTLSGKLPLEKSQTLSGILALTQSGIQEADLSRLFQLPVASVGDRTGADYFKLSWSHYVTLLTIDNREERQFYEIEANQNNWSVRELDRQINSSLYQRLALSRDKEEIRRLATEGQVVAKAADLIKNPLILEFLDLDERSSYSERELETTIIDKLQAFMLELGKGFLFEARQRRFTFDDKHYYVDLVLYNRLLRCYVLIDLKLEELTHGDLGQMQMYVNYFDRHVRIEGELPTVGIVLCARKNDAMVELTLPQDANIFASKYQLYLPSKEELKRELEKIESEIEEFGLERDE